MDQHKWLSQELNRRGFLHLNGCGALPSLDNAPTQPVEKNESYHMALKQVQSDVGSLMWVSLRTRPDIQACTSMLSCLSTGLKKVWRYLRGTFWLRLKYTGSCERTILAASDASFAPQGSRSRTGIRLFVGEDLISCRSVRQGPVAWSTMECETDAAASGLQEALRLKTIIEELEGAKFEIRMLVSNLRCVT